MNYVARASDEGIEMLGKTNSFRVLVADSKTWRTAIEDFKESFVNTLDTANAEIGKFREKFYLLSSSIAPSVMRTNGGEVSNGNGMDFEFESVVNLLELVREFYESYHEKFCVYYFKKNAISENIRADLLPFLKKYPTDTSFLKGCGKDGVDGFLIDVDAFIAKENDFSNIALGVSCKCSLKDAGGDAILAGIRHMTEFLKIPALGMFRLYDAAEVSDTQYKSCPFYNKRESNFYNKVKTLRESDDAEYRLFGLDTRPELDLPLSKYCDVAEVWSVAGYKYVWDKLVGHNE
jgi:hypothetical protein